MNAALAIARDGELRPLRRPAAWLLDRLIAAYQRFISPLLPPACRFTPSCSCYARQALATHRTLSATRLITWRLLRCQPLCAGGVDPVPPGPWSELPIAGRFDREETP